MTVTSAGKPSLNCLKTKINLFSPINYFEIQKSGKTVCYCMFIAVFKLSI